MDNLLRRFVDIFRIDSIDMNALTGNAPILQRTHLHRVQFKLASLSRQNTENNRAASKSPEKQYLCKNHRISIFYSSYKHRQYFATPKNIKINLQSVDY
jgi:hypothetical protein